MTTSYDNDLAQAGADYIKRREAELYAAVTEKARQESQLAALIRDGADPAAIEALIQAKAQIERDIPIIGRDLSLSAQSANLSFFLVRMEQAIEGLRTDVREGITASQDIARGLGKLESRMTASEQDRKQLNDRMARIESMLEARPAAREREHQAILNAIILSHAEPLNDDGHDGP